MWEVFGRARVDLFASKDNSHCPIFFTKFTDAMAHEWLSLPLYGFPPIALLPQVLRRVREHIVYSNSRGVGVIPAARSIPMAISLEAGPPLSSERYAMASTARVMGPACVATQQEPFSLPKRLLNTMAEARAPSTRRLYALKWSVFSTWCQDRDFDPVTSIVLVVLSFLEDMLDKPRSSSTINVYAPAIAAFHAPLLVDRWAKIEKYYIFTRRQENESPASS